MSTLKMKVIPVVRAVKLVSLVSSNWVTSSLLLDGKSLGHPAFRGWGDLPGGRKKGLRLEDSDNLN
jgi:hypothetical protein